MADKKETEEVGKLSSLLSLPLLMPRYPVRRQTGLRENTDGEDMLIFTLTRLHLEQP